MTEHGARRDRPGLAWRARAHATLRRNGVGALLLTPAAVVAGLAWRAGAAPSPATALALVAASAAASRLPLGLGLRSRTTLATPCVLLAGLAGGALVGGAAGIAAALPRSGPARGRRAVVGLLQGVLAGLVATQTSGGAAGAVAAVCLASALAVMLAAAARSLPGSARTGPGPVERRRAAALDAVEAALTAPLVAALVVGGGPLLVPALAAIGAALALTQRRRARGARRLAQAQRGARVDALTGAPNRRAFEEALAAEYARITRGGPPAGLFVVDLDRFKSVNDRYGHATGDDVLVAVVDRLRSSLRPADVVARWGGEEIAVLAPGMVGAGLGPFAERVRRLIGDTPIATRRTALALTVSVGGTLLDRSRSPQSAFRAADAALYEAKRRRDHAVVAAPVEPAPRLRSA